MKTECSDAELVAFKDRFHESFSYNPETGVVRWKDRPRSHFKREQEWKRHNLNYSGKEAGSVSFRPDKSPCYKVVSFRLSSIKRRFYLHRVIFVLMGVDVQDDQMIDHRDGDIFNNRWENLRLAKPQQSAQNRHNHKGKKLPKWVSMNKQGKFTGKLTFSGRTIYLGIFNTPESAHLACLEKAKQLHGEFLRTS